MRLLDVGFSLIMSFVFPFPPPLFSSIHAYLVASFSYSFRGFGDVIDKLVEPFDAVAGVNRIVAGSYQQLAHPSDPSGE
jgi:hypothetical protein